jgi:hydrogenase expression/formation protein HypC
MALPGQITSIDGVEAEVVISGATQKAGLQLHPDACIGDYVLVKTGLVVEVLSEDDAKDLMAFFDQMIAFLDQSGDASETDQLRTPDLRPPTSDPVQTSERQN